MDTLTKQTSTEEIDLVFEKQMKHFQEVGKTSASERISKLKALSKVILREKDAIAEAISNDFSKPLFESYLSEINVALGELGHTISHLEEWMQSEPMERYLLLPTLSGEIEYRPKGVCLILSPWNYPFNLAIGPLISAIAAGNTVILKPSELTPHTSLFMKKMLAELFDESEVAVILGEADVASYLTELPFHHIFFTGSPQVGKLVMSAAAKNLTSVTLELGGKCPVIVTESAHIKQAAERIAFGKFINSGQTCVAPDYVLVHNTKEDEFIQELKSSLEKMQEKADLDDSLFCKIITPRHTDRLKNITEDAFEKGAEVVLGGTFHSTDRLADFTILKNVNDEMKIMQEEIFGPIIPIISYESFDKALARVNSLPRPLASYIFTKKRNQVREMSESIRAGSVVQNDTVVQFTYPVAPFGGIGNSGFGNSHGFYGFRAFSHEQPVMKMGSWSAASLFHPPYTQSKKKLFNWIMKWF